MQPDDPNLLVLKQRPLLLWLFSAILAITGLILMFSPGLLIPGLICLGAGLLVYLIASVDTLTLDKNRNRFSLQRRYPWRATLKESHLDELSGFELEQNQDSDGGRTYRIIAVLATGESIPLTSVYTSGREVKRRRMEMLNQWLRGDLSPASQAAIAVGKCGRARSYNQAGENPAPEGRPATG